MAQDDLTANTKSGAVPPKHRYRCLLGAVARVAAVVEVEATDRGQAARLARRRAMAGDLTLTFRRIASDTVAVTTVLRLDDFNEPGRRPDDQLARTQPSSRKREQG